MKLTGLALTICVVFAGCTTHPIRLDNIEGAKFNEARGREVQTETCGLMMGPIPVRVRSHLVRAEQNLKRSAGVDAVFTNVRVKESWYYLLIGQLLCTEIQATAYPRTP